MLGGSSNALAVCNHNRVQIHKFSTKPMMMRSLDGGRRTVHRTRPIVLTKSDRECCHDLTLFPCRNLFISFIFYNSFLRLFAVFVGALLSLILPDVVDCTRGASFYWNGVKTKVKTNDGRSDDA